MNVDWTKGKSHECAGGSGSHGKREPTADAEANTSAAPDSAHELAVGPHGKHALRARGLANGNKHANTPDGVYIGRASSKDGKTLSKVASIWATITVNGNDAYVKVCGFDIDMNKYGLSKCECYWE